MVHNWDALFGSTSAASVFQIPQYLPQTDLHLHLDRRSVAEVRSLCMLARRSMEPQVVSCVPVHCAFAASVLRIVRTQLLRFKQSLLFWISIIMDGLSMSKELFVALYIL